MPRRLADYSDESLIAEVRRVASLSSDAKPLGSADFDKHAMVSSGTLRNRFGQWKDVLAAAGLASRWSNSQARISAAEVITELRKVAEIIGSNEVKKADFQRHAKFSIDAVTRRLGSWKKALQTAGLSQCKKGDRYSDDECYENLLRVWTHYGRAPYHREMNLPPSVIGPKAYILRWGSWSKGIHAFAGRVNRELAAESQPLETGSPERSVTSGEPRVGRPQEECRDIRPKLRWEILIRDRCRCQICGANRNDIDLHVDHIVPFSKGGKTTPENLRTLCSRCNLGKSDCIEPDGRSTET